MKLILYPLKVQSADDVKIVCKEDTVLTEIGNGHSCTKLEAKKRTLAQTYFCVDLTGGIENAIIHKAESLWVFSDPPDFYIHPKLETQQHMYDMHNFLYHSSVEECYQYFMNNSDVLGRVDLYPPLNLRTPIMFNSPPTPRPEIKQTVYDLATVFDGKLGVVPNKPLNEIKLTLSHKFPKTVDKVSSFILAHFQKIPVITEKIQSNLFSELQRTIDPTFTRTNFRDFVRSYCYFFQQGAFYKCWVLLGNDLRKNPNNYKYQRLAKYKLQTELDFLYEDPTLVEMIEKKRHAYISEQYDHFNGFFKSELIIFLRNLFAEKHIDSILKDR